MSLANIGPLAMQAAQLRTGILERDRLFRENLRRYKLGNFRKMARQMQIDRAERKQKRAERRAKNIKTGTTIASVFLLGANSAAAAPTEAAAAGTEAAAAGATSTDALLGTIDAVNAGTASTDILTGVNAINAGANLGSGGLLEGIAALNNYSGNVQAVNGAPVGGVDSVLGTVDSVNAGIGSGGEQAATPNFLTDLSTLNTLRDFGSKVFDNLSGGNPEGDSQNNSRKAAILKMLSELFNKNG